MRIKSEYTARMDIRDHLPPKQVMNILIGQVHRRIDALKSIQLKEYAIALHELDVVHDLLTRARNYIERGEGIQRR